jgi:hypothetical protein
VPTVASFHFSTSLLIFSKRCHLADLGVPLQSSPSSRVAFGHWTSVPCAGARHHDDRIRSLAEPLHERPKSSRLRAKRQRHQGPTAGAASDCTFSDPPAQLCRRCRRTYDCGMPGQELV